MVAGSALINKESIMKTSRYDSNIHLAKRAFDVVVSMLILLVSLPAMPIIAMAITINSKDLSFIVSFVWVVVHQTRWSCLKS